MTPHSAHYLTRSNKYKMPRHPAHGSGGFKIDGVPCRLVSLTRGQFAIVEDSRFEEIDRSNWTASKSSRNSGHYAVRTVLPSDGSKPFTISMHRQLLGLSPGDPQTVDHKDPLKTLLNISSNLRRATEEEQQRNTGKRKTNTTGFKGVNRRTDRDLYQAYIYVNGARRYVGSAKTAEAVAAKRVDAASKLHGEFARSE